MFKAAYIKLHESGKLALLASEAHEALKECSICPRDCRVNRVEEEVGFCGIGSRGIVSSAHPHFGEEAPLVGQYGSGTIFFSSCNLRCIFCQNYEISHLIEGRPSSSRELAAMMIQLQDTGCHNINLVTPTHVVPQILAALVEAVEMGLKVPIVYNTGGYDLVKTLKLLEDVVDIYMPDIKFHDSKIANYFAGAPDYPEVSKATVMEMHRQVGDLIVDEHGVAKRGLLVRHLLMPNDYAGTREIMRFLAQKVSKNTYVNIMDQYHPYGEIKKYPEMLSLITREEFEKALEVAREEGITRFDKVIYRR